MDHRPTNSKNDLHASRSSIYAFVSLIDNYIPLIMLSTRMYVWTDIEQPTKHAEINNPTTLRPVSLLSLFYIYIYVYAYQSVR